MTIQADFNELKLTQKMLLAASAIGGAYYLWKNDMVKFDGCLALAILTGWMVNTTTQLEKKVAVLTKHDEESTPNSYDRKVASVKKNIARIVSETLKPKELNFDDEPKNPDTSS